MTGADKGMSDAAIGEVLRYLFGRGGPFPVGMATKLRESLENVGLAIVPVEVRDDYAMHRKPDAAPDPAA